MDMNAPDSIDGQGGPGILTRLRRYSIAMGLLHAIQGAVVLFLANSFTLPVTATFLEGPPGSPAAEPVRLANVSVAWGVATFLLLSAAFHLLISLPTFFERYRAGLAHNRNYFRWVEYSLSSSVMIVLIAMLTGISDIAALIAVFGVNASMIFFGAVQEKYEPPGGSLMPFWLGCLAGVIPWVAIGFYLFTPGSAAQPPAFVYGVFFSLFVCFNAFALNMWLQYRKVGRWRDYLYGERVYVILSLVAKSALAWQLFAGTLAL
jgi:Heliorhodopsin